MATAKSMLSPFQQISLHPLVGILDTRSRPADIPPSAFRWKLNLQTTVDAKLCRRQGFDKFIPAGAEFVNQDLHAQGATRKPVPFLFENTTSSGTRQLFAGTEDSLWLLEPTTGDWVPLLNPAKAAAFQATWLLENPFLPAVDGPYPNNTCGAPGARWRADALQNMVFFTNGVDPPCYYDSAYGQSLVTSLGPGAEAGAFHPVIDCLAVADNAIEMTGINGGTWIGSAQVVIQFCGVLIWMNITDNTGNRYPTKILWSNLNQGLIYSPCVDANNNPSGYVGSPPAPPTNGSVTVCGFQDLPYGDEIVGSALLLGSLYVFTRRGIWRMSPGAVGAGNIVASGATASNIWAFTQIYNEPANQTGCLVYPFSLVSTGIDLYYMSREAIYKYNPYMVKPEATTEEMQWLYRAAGAMFKKQDTYVDSTYCNLPSACYTPVTGELWFSWPSYNNNLANRNDDASVVLNNWTLVVSHQNKTADVLDCGFSAFVNYRETPTSGACNESQDFLAASTMDYAIKEIGGVFYRAYIRGSTTASGYDPTADNPVSGVTYQLTAYNSLFRLLIPTGYFDRDKLVRLVHLEDDTTPENLPALLTVRVGQSYTVQDPNEAQSNTAPVQISDTECGVLWQPYQSQPLACSDALTMAEMAAQNLAPSQAKDYAVWIENRYLYCEVAIIQPTSPGPTPSAGDCCLEQASFDCQGLVKV